MLWELLQNGFSVCAVVRAEDNDHAQRRVDKVLAEVESIRGPLAETRSENRPVCFAADITRDQLGLSSQALTWIKNHGSSILHNAASVSFDDHGSQTIYNDNVSGAKNLIGMCAATEIRQLHHVSTAYVCGLRSGVVHETDLEFGQTFRNEYERSKFEIERLFRQCDLFENRTIYRPAVIAGDSTTGYTHTFHGIFYYLKLISIIVASVMPDHDGRRHTPIRLDMHGEEERNVVPVEWVSQVICHLMGNQSAWGNTFHLAPQIPLTPRQIIAAGYSYFNSYGIEFCGTQAVIENPSQLDHDWHSNMSIYKSYEHTDPQFDRTNLDRFAGQLPCPIIDESVLHRYWDYGESINWGKRRKAKV